MLQIHSCELFGSSSTFQLLESDQSFSDRQLRQSFSLGHVTSSAGSGWDFPAPSRSSQDERPSARLTRLISGEDVQSWANREQSA